MHRFTRFTPRIGIRKPLPALTCITAATYITYTYTTTPHTTEPAAGLFGNALSVSNLFGFGRRKGRQISQPCILALDLQEPYKDAPDSSPFSKQMTMRELVNAISAAATDDNVRGIIANISQRESAWTLSQVQELGQAIQYFRANNKVCVAYADSLGGVGTGMANYVLGCMFDRLVVQQTCDFPLAGPYIENYFLRGLLDMLNIDFQVFRRREYKNALNTVSETGYTEAHKENVVGYTSSLLDQVVELIAFGRNLSQDAVRDAIRHGVHNTEDALQRGLIDGIEYEHTLPAYCKRLCIEADAPNAAEYRQALLEDGVKQPATPASPKSVLTVKPSNNDSPDEPHVDELLATYRFSAYYQQLQKQREAKRKSAAKLLAKQPKIALIYGCGPVTNVANKDTNPLKSLAGTFHSTTFATTLVRAAQDSTVKAIVLRVDTPGGSVVASDTVYEAVKYVTKTLNKPVIVSYGNVSASGGVYSTACATMIVAMPGTITGSIGVIAGKPAIGRLLRNKLAINAEGIELEGDIGRMGSLALPLHDDHMAIWNKVIDEMYNGFVQRVADGRNKTFDEVEQLARGRVYTGEQALQLGLIDGLGTLETAITYAREALPEDVRESAEVEVHPKPLTLNKLIRKLISSEVEEAEKDAEPLFDGVAAGADSVGRTAKMFGDLCETSSAVNGWLAQTQMPAVVKQLMSRETASAAIPHTTVRSI